MATNQSVRPDGRSKKSKPYASISTTLLATSRVRQLASNNPAAFRLWLWANASWTPLNPLILSTTTLPERLRMKRHTLIDARRQLAELDLLVMTKKSSKPGGAGWQDKNGRAAEFSIPQRISGAKQKFEPSDRGLPGMLRVDAATLRAWAGAMGPGTCPLWCFIAAQPRTKAGALEKQPDLTVAALAKFLNQPRASIYRALNALKTAGLMAEIDGKAVVTGWLATGRRGGRAEAGAWLLQDVSHLRQSSAITLGQPLEITQSDCSISMPKIAACLRRGTGFGDFVSDGTHVEKVAESVTSLAEMPELQPTEEAPI